MEAKLKAVKLIHTFVWALLALCVVSIPLLVLADELTIASWLVIVVMVEVLVLVVNGMHCPLTGVAAKYTTDRAANFDIYLPLWLAANNQKIFGTVYVIGLLMTVLSWFLREPT